jgi:hypothetical protein
VGTGTEAGVWVAVAESVWVGAAVGDTAVAAVAASGFDRVHAAVSAGAITAIPDSRLVHHFFAILDSPKPSRTGGTLPAL